MLYFQPLYFAFIGKIILMSQLLLTQQWLCSTDFNDWLPCRLFWDSLQSTDFWHWISGCFWIVYYQGFFANCFWNSRFYCQSCLDGSFLLPSQTSPLAQRCQELLIPSLWHHGPLPRQCLRAVRVNGLVFLQKLCRRKGEIRGSTNILMTCTHTNVCEKRTGEECKSWKPRS